MIKLLISFFIFIFFSNSFGIQCISPKVYWYNATNEKITIDRRTKGGNVTQEIIDPDTLQSLTQACYYYFIKRSRYGKPPSELRYWDISYKIFTDSQKDYLSLEPENFQKIVEENAETVFMIEEDKNAPSGIQATVLSKKEFDQKMAMKKKLVKEKVHETTQLPQGVCGIIAEY